jgi:hypothetical protein
MVVLHLRGSNLLEGIYLSIGLLLGQQCLNVINLFVEGVFLLFKIGICVCWQRLRTWLCSEF